MYKVKDEFRKNHLSLEPGGDEVRVIYQGETRIYDKVKYPDSFAKTIIKKCQKEGRPLPNKIETKSEVLWERS